MKNIREIQLYGGKYRMCIYRRAMGSGGEHFFPIEPIRTYQNLSVFSGFWWVLVGFGEF